MHRRDYHSLDTNFSKVLREKWDGAIKHFLQIFFEDTEDDLL